MPFALVFLGIIFVVTGVKGTIGALGSQLKQDFTGEGNFLYWFLAIGSVGTLGAIPDFRNFSRLFMTLILVAMVIRNGGVFDKLVQAIKSGPVAPHGDEISTASKSQDYSALSQNSVAIGASALASAAATAHQSINTSAQQQSNPAQNAGALTKILGLFM